MAFHCCQRNSLRKTGDSLALWAVFGVPFSCHILLADTESFDEYFVDKYTGGNMLEFLEKCDSSIEQTDRYLDTFREEYPSGRFVSGSFLNMFGLELISLEKQYAEELTSRYKKDQLGRVDKDIERRSRLYETMYGSSVGHGFLAGRTIRTMGQYLALGTVIGRDPQSCMIVHDTVNASLFQDINKYSPGETNLATVPVIKQDVRVY